MTTATYPEIDRPTEDIIRDYLEPNAAAIASGLDVEPLVDPTASSRPLTIPYPELNARFVMSTTTEPVAGGEQVFFQATSYRNGDSRPAWTGTFPTKAVRHEAIQKQAQAMRTGALPALVPVLKVTEDEFNALVADDAGVCLTCGEIEFETLRADHPWAVLPHLRRERPLRPDGPLREEPRRLHESELLRTAGLLRVVDPDEHDLSPRRAGSRCGGGSGRPGDGGRTSDPSRRADMIASRSKTETFQIFSHAPDGVRCRLCRLHSKGVVSATVERRSDEYLVIAVCKPGSEAAREARRLQDRGFQLRRIAYAIQAGHAYLDTAWGRRKVIGYNDRTGDAVTRNDGEDAYGQAHVPGVHRSDQVVSLVSDTWYA